MAAIVGFGNECVGTGVDQLSVPKDRLAVIDDVEAHSPQISDAAVYSQTPRDPRQMRRCNWLIGVLHQAVFYYFKVTLPLGWYVVAHGVAGFDFFGEAGLPARFTR